MTTTTDNGVRTEIEWTREGWEKFGEMRDQVVRCRLHYGEGIADEMQTTLSQCMFSLFACGPTRVSKAFDFDGLYVQAAWIQSGIVFHPDPPERRKSRLARLGFHYTDDEVRPDWPTTGTWSQHS